MTPTSTEEFLTFCPLSALPNTSAGQVKYTLERIVSMFQLSHWGKVGKLDSDIEAEK